MLPRTVTFIIMVMYGTSFAYAGACDETVLSENVADHLISHTPLGLAHTTLFGLQIGVADLDAVQTQLGKTHHLPRKESSPERLCYTGKSSTSPIAVFEAGAMGGWRFLTSFCVLSPAEGKALRKLCAATDKINDIVGTDGGLKLGMDRLKVEALLGRPTVQVKGKDNYWRSYKSENNFDVTEIVSVTHAGGKVTGVRVSKVETN